MIKPSISFLFKFDFLLIKIYTVRKYTIQRKKRRNENKDKYIATYLHYTKNEFSIKDLFSECDQIRRKLRIWSHLLQKSLMKNFISCAVLKCWCWRIYVFECRAKTPYQIFFRFSTVSWAHSQSWNETVIISLLSWNLCRSRSDSFLCKMYLQIILYIYIYIYIYIYVVNWKSFQIPPAECAL